MNTMPSTAPTSADACLSIVHSLMCHRVSIKNYASIDAISLC